MNTKDDEWQTLGWLNGARELIQWTRKQSENHPVLLVIRHSHRDDSTNFQELQKKHLTDLGQQMAYCFGKKLPPNRNLEPSYSGLPRCQETVQAIREGYVDKGNHADLVSSIPIIMGPQGNEDRIGHEMLKLGSAEFVRMWTEGKLSEEIIVPIEEFSAAFLRETLGRLRDASKNLLHIHATHDLMIMGIRSILFGTIPSDNNWTSYLGGFGIALADGKIHAFEEGKELMFDDDALLISLTSSEKPL